MLFGRPGGKSRPFTAYGHSNSPKQNPQIMPAQSKKKVAASSRACANCGALEDPSDMPLSACSRCHIVSYCSKPCQANHWKQKPGGHKQFCVTPDERRPGAAQPDRNPSVPTTGMVQANDFPEPISTRAKCDECAICLEPLDPSSTGDCTHRCSHAFHVPCSAGLRPFGIKPVFPMCRA